MKAYPSPFGLVKYALGRPVDEYLTKQWYLKNTGKDPETGDTTDYSEGADAKVLEAWDVLGNFGSEKIKLAVLDDGFDLTHPDFNGKIVHPKDLFPTPTNDGLIDFLMRDPDAHGTLCAGIALASNNGRGIVGVAPSARFMPIRTFSLEDFDLDRMFVHAVQSGADIISCSMGLPGRKMSKETFDLIREHVKKGRNGKGLIFCMASGNEMRELEDGEFPTHPDIICVGASSGMDTYPDYSNRSSSLAIVAPGGFGNAKMITTDVGKYMGSDGVERDGGKVEGLYYQRFEGTSASCPLVAGVCALILSANPNLTAKEVKSILCSSADKIGGPREYNDDGHSKKFGFGRINAANAVRMALGQDLVASGFTGSSQSYMGELAAKGEKLYKFTVKQRKISIQLQGPTSGADFDLFVKRGSEASDTNFDKRSVSDSSNEAVVLDNAVPGVYYVLVKSYSGSGEFNLKVKIADQD